MFAGQGVGYTCCCARARAHASCACCHPRFASSALVGITFAVQVKQLPNFLIALPAIGVCSSALYSYAVRHAALVGSGGLTAACPYAGPPALPQGPEGVAARKVVFAWYLAVQLGIAVLVMHVQVIAFWTRSCAGLGGWGSGELARARARGGVGWGVQDPGRKGLASNEIRTSSLGGGGGCGPQFTAIYRIFFGGGGTAILPRPPRHHVL